jgi:hypothetical protein
VFVFLLAHRLGRRWACIYNTVKGHRCGHLVIVKTLSHVIPVPMERPKFCTYGKVRSDHDEKDELVKRLTMLRTLLISLLFLSQNAFAQECTADGLCDTHERCPVWKNEGECVRNRSYMDEHCPAQCVGNNVVLKKGECDDIHERCSVWAAAGDCMANSEDMEKYCKKACDLCDAKPEKGKATVKQSTEHLSIVCKDEEVEETCAALAELGECESNKGFMIAKCAKSCGVCNDEQGLERSVLEQLELLGIDPDILDQVVEKSATFGLRQVVMGIEVVDVINKIEETITYMNNEKTRQLPTYILNNWCVHFGLKQWFSHFRLTRSNLRSVFQP